MKATIVLVILVCASSLFSQERSLINKDKSFSWHQWKYNEVPTLPQFITPLFPNVDGFDENQEFSDVKKESLYKIPIYDVREDQSKMKIYVPITKPKQYMRIEEPSEYGEN